MEIKLYQDPFPHIIVENFYSEKELEEIWLECEFLLQPNKLKSRDDTGSALENGVFQKDNKGIWLEHSYTERNLSNILTHNRKIFCEQMLEAASKNWMMKYLCISNSDSTLLSYYEQQEYYNPHHDICVLTAVVNLYKEPRAFSGGEFSFTDFAYNLGIKNNRLVLFPSAIRHQVDTVNLMPNNHKTIPGRIAMSTFILVK